MTNLKFKNEDEAYDYWYDNIYSYDTDTWACLEHKADPHDMFSDWLVDEEVTFED